MDERLRAGIEGILKPLNQELWLLDQTGRGLWPDGIHAYFLPDDLDSRQASAMNGHLFLRLDEDKGWVLMTRDGPLAADLLLLAAQLIRVRMLPDARMDALTAAWLKLLSSDISREAREALVRRHHIRDGIPRCVLLFSLPSLGAQEAYEALMELLPLGEEDVLLNRVSAFPVLVKALEDGQELTELHEFAQALQETLMEEAGLKLCCAIGERAQDLRGLPGSFASAQQALDIGPRFPSKQGIYLWEQMLLPRVLNEISPQKADAYHRLLFQPGTAPLFSQEMLLTARSFLDKDLNLSDTARQLYIHRNTLVYRLDKIQRMTGLDLRRFDDAFLYKLLLELGRAQSPYGDPSLD